MARTRSSTRRATKASPAKIAPVTYKRGAKRAIPPKIPPVHCKRTPLPRKTRKGSRSTDQLIASENLDRSPSKGWKTDRRRPEGRAVDHAESDSPASLGCSIANSSRSESSMGLATVCVHRNLKSQESPPPLRARTTGGGDHSRMNRQVSPVRFASLESQEEGEFGGL